MSDAITVESSGEVVGIGLDAGSTTCKIVGVDGDGTLVAWALQPMSPRIEDQAAALVADLRAACPTSLEARLFATGYGRKLVQGADRSLTEISCHAAGVYADTGTEGTLVDIGGQDSKVIRIGAGGTPIDFAMNDKCAAGTGRFLENTAQRLGVPLDELGPRALAAQHRQQITSTCTVFAESEIISLVAHGTEIDDILAGLHAGLVARVLAMVRGVGLVPPLMLSGGVARNTAIVGLLEQLSGEPVRLPSRPQLMGAYGAALLAASATGNQHPDPAQAGVVQLSSSDCTACEPPQADVPPPSRRRFLGGLRRS